MQTKRKPLCFKVKDETIEQLERCRTKSGALTRAEVLRLALSHFEEHLDHKDTRSLLLEIRGMLYDAQNDPRKQKSAP